MGKEEKGVAVTPQKEELQQVQSIEGLISQAITNNVPVETMERLLVLFKEIKADKAREAFVEAMAKLQEECPVIKKEENVYEKNSNTNVRYKFAKLDSIVNQTKKIISDNGFSYRFTEEKDDKYMMVNCIVTHIKGHSEVTPFKIPIGTEAYMSDVQKHGARMTFAKRYAFCNAFGITTGDEDVDANEPQQSKQHKGEVSYGSVESKGELPKKIQSMILNCKTEKNLGIISLQIAKSKELTEEVKKQLQKVVVLKQNEILKKKTK